MSKTIIISNRLPVKISLAEEGFDLRQSEGGLATGLGSIFPQGENVWIGWPGIEIAEEQQPHVKKKLKESSLEPVFLTQEEINLYYEGFSNETLWPIFHYFPSYASYHQTYWNAYQEVNKKFKETVLQIIKPGDIVWIHDYQLLLLPGMIREAVPEATIGFFLHIPFPSVELFRLIPWRLELLEGLMGADLIGFHTYDDGRHFLSSVTRLIPVHAMANTININDRQVVVDAFPMGIDNRKFEDMTRKESVMRQVDELKENFKGSKIILSIDRLDYSKGIVQRILAFEKLLKENPEYLEKVILYMIVVPSRDTVPQYRELRDEIDKIAGNINAYYRTLNWLPIHYYYRPFPVETLSALYSLADLCLVTPMRDGMNLVCKEYVASRIHDDGVLILSEMAGAAKELVDALIVNPNNINEIHDAMIAGLEMTPQEQQRRMKPMREVVSKFNIRHWVKIYMDRLKEVKDMQASLQAKIVGSSVKSLIENEYRKSKKRIIFLDYDGTLVGFQAYIDLAAPDEEIYNILAQLAADQANEIILISGRTQDTLDKWFGKLPVNLIAEHGAWQKKVNEEWTKIPGLSDSWKQEVYPILETYMDRTPGSFIEVKNYALVWHYRRVERFLGELRANELMTNLRIFAADKGLQILPGNKVVEVKNIEINKGRAALSWLEERDYDFILAMGDDHTDEDLFKVLPERAISIKVNGTVSAAKYYLRDFRDVRLLLKALLAQKELVSKEHRAV